MIDVAPTILEAAGLPEPAFVNGVQQAPIEGTSMVYSFDHADAPERHDLQYFEMAGNRGIYYKGWSAVTRHSTPWLPSQVLPALDDDVWELYDGNNDWTQAHDLAAEDPARLAALQRLWLIEAVKYNVLPIDDRRFERLNATIAGRPQLITGTTQVLFPGMKRLSENSVIDIKNRSFSVTAAIETAATRNHEGRDHRAGRPVRRLGAVRQGRSRQVRLQRPRHAGVRHRGDRAAPRGQPPGARRVRLRRRRSREGRRPHPVLRRHASSAAAGSS